MISPTVTAKTVIVADDTAFVRDRFRIALEGAGHKAVTVKSGETVKLSVELKKK